MKNSIKILSFLFITFIGTAFIIEDSFAARSRGRRVRTATDNTVIPPTEGTETTLENPFAPVGTTTEELPKEDDSLTELQEKLNSTTNSLEQQPPAPTADGGGETEEEEEPLGDVKTSKEYKALKRTLQDFCSAGDMAPLYYACFNKYKLESAFIEALEEMEYEEDKNIVAMEEEFKGMIKKKKMELCSSGDGKWVEEGKETCQYKVVYKRKGKSVEKWFNVGKRFRCGHDTFGLGVLREKVDDSAKKMAMIMGTVQTGLSAVSMVSNSTVNLGGKKNAGLTDDQKSSLKGKSKEEKKALRDSYKTANEKKYNDLSSSIEEKTKDFDSTFMDSDDIKSHNKNIADLKSERDKYSTSNGSDFDLDMDSFQGVASGVGGMMQASIEHKEQQRNADEIYGVCEFGNDTIPEGNTVRIEWIF